MRVLVLNAGSSSLKASVVDDGATVARTSIGWGADATHAPDRGAAIRAVLEAAAREGVSAGSLHAVGHRVVHGGTRFVAPTRIDPEVLVALDAMGELAPLHNAVAVETIRRAAEVLPGVPQVACFDTSFHAGMPETVARYPVPAAWHDEWGIRRYGFHGLSVEWAAERAAEVLGRRPEDLELVVAHLGSGCSVTAVSGGRSVWNSMGFTPLEGLMMGTRSGSLDPGIVVHLLRSGRLDLEAVADALDHQSGLSGVSGLGAHVPELERAADSGDPRATLALAMFVDRAAAGIAAAATALPRLDGLVFSGGIGEYAGRVRAAIVARLAVVGVRPIRDVETGDDRILEPAAATGSRAPGGPVVLRIEAREDLVIARAVQMLVSPAAGRS